MRITSKGQVTIPLAIRTRLKLLPETEVEFEIDGNAVRISRSRNSPGRGRRIVSSLRGRSTVKLSTEQIMSLTRE